MIYQGFTTIPNETVVVNSRWDFWLPRAGSDTSAPSLVREMLLRVMTPPGALGGAPGAGGSVVGG